MEGGGKWGNSSEGLAAGLYLRVKKWTRNSSEDKKKSLWNSYHFSFRLKPLKFLRIFLCFPKWTCLCIQMINALCFCHCCCRCCWPFILGFVLTFLWQKEFAIKDKKSDLYQFQDKCLAHFEKLPKINTSNDFKRWMMSFFFHSLSLWQKWILMQEEFLNRWLKGQFYNLD